MFVEVIFYERLFNLHIVAYDSDGHRMRYFCTDIVTVECLDKEFHEAEVKWKQARIITEIDTVTYMFFFNKLTYISAE